MKKTRITLREISSSNTDISSTRWALAVIVLFDVIIIGISIIASIIAHFMGKPFDEGLFGGISLLLGIPTALITGAKITQGFEHKENDINGKT